MFTVALQSIFFLLAFLRCCKVILQTASSAPFPPGWADFLFHDMSLSAELASSCRWRLIRGEFAGGIFLGFLLSFVLPVTVFFPLTFSFPGTRFTSSSLFMAFICFDVASFARQFLIALFSVRACVEMSASHVFVLGDAKKNTIHN